MAKKVTGYLKLQVPAGAANPSPPIGPALGQRGLNIMEFCKAFNAQTQKLEKGAPIPVVITIYGDRSFTFEMKTPPMSHFLKKAAKLESGSKTPGRALEQDGRGRRLGDEGQGAIRVDRDDDRDDETGLRLRLRVERLAELHDVDAALPERRTDRRARVGRSRGNLQLDLGYDLLRHPRLRPSRPARSRARPA